ncbi:hypothetical protein XENTR_v10011167 [Xenopus tropicalis]|nr:hypothetical protein XENTR_v10011167 [Xenopus tropicalis]
MADGQKAAAFRRSSGLLVNAPPDLGGEVKALNDALGKLSAVTRAISANVRHINETLERILVDKPDIEELERILNFLTQKKE